MIETNWNRLISFIHEQWPFVGQLALTRSTRLEHDLGVHGDDLDEFLSAFVQRFHIDYDKFTAAKFFNIFSTGFILVDFIYMLFPSLQKKKQTLIRALTLGDLEMAINQGRLDDDVILGHSWLYF